MLLGLAELAGEGGTIAFTDRIGKRRAVAIGLVVATVGFAGVGMAQTEVGFGMAALLIGIFGFEFTIVSTIPLSTEMVPTARTRYLAWSIVATSLGRAGGAALGSALFEAFGVTSNAVFATVANIVALVLLLLFVQEIARSDSADGSVAG